MNRLGLLATPVGMVVLVVMLSISPVILAEDATTDVGQTNVTASQSSDGTAQESEAFTDPEGADPEPLEQPVQGTNESWDKSSGLVLGLQYQFVFVTVTVAFGVLALFVVAFIGRRTGLTEHFSRTVIIILVITAVMFLMGAGYSNAQVAPAFGLLGAIVGYLFGKDETRADQTSETDGN